MNFFNQNIPNLWSSTTPKPRSRQYQPSSSQKNYYSHTPDLYQTPAAKTPIGGGHTHSTQTPYRTPSSSSAMKPLLLALTPACTPLPPQHEPLAQLPRDLPTKPPIELPPPNLLRRTLLIPPLPPPLNSPHPIQLPSPPLLPHPLPLLITLRLRP